MTDPHTPEPPAPDPVGEVVPGDPPVPITVWYVPAPPSGAVASSVLITRLTANYSHPRQRVIDLIRNPDGLAHPGRPPAELIISTWPAGRATAGHPTPQDHLADCAQWLLPGGCVAIVVATPDVPDQLAVLVQAARAAGLRYLQHIVAAHYLARPGQPAAGLQSDPRGERHLRVHTDVLLMRSDDGPRDPTLCEPDRTRPQPQSRRVRGRRPRGDR